MKKPKQLNRRNDKSLSDEVKNVWFTTTTNQLWTLNHITLQGLQYVDRCRLTITLDTYIPPYECSSHLPFFHTTLTNYYYPSKWIMEGPRTAGYHHHQFKASDEMKHHRVLAGQDALTDLISFSLNCNELTSPCEVTLTSFFVFYRFGK